MDMRTATVGWFIWQSFKTQVYIDYSYRSAFIYKFLFMDKNVLLPSGRSFP